MDPFRDGVEHMLGSVRPNVSPLRPNAGRFRPATQEIASRICCKVMLREDLKLARRGPVMTRCMPRLGKVSEVQYLG